MKEINFKKIEKKWQKKWGEKKIFEANDNSKKLKYYALEMFPYPSGSGLHMGHAWNYIIGDILARFKLMNNFNVLHPMGYDSLGLPAENAAIKKNVHPSDYTTNSIKNFIKQQKSLGLSYDWSRMLKTSDPNYYKWDQWIFLKMFEKGLAYQKESDVNWCSGCRTVLANEQAQAGSCERCGTKVEMKYLKQWFLKITNYADELYEGINKLKQWPDRTKAMQKNWIGKKEWIDINYEIEGTAETVTVSTTRPDTNFGATFVVIAPEHFLLSKKKALISDERRKEVDNYIGQSKKKTHEERIEEGKKKTGVFTGLYCINQLTGRKMPLWIADFVLTDVGTGVVVGVPGHDKRDFGFAKEFGLPIIRVVVGSDGDKSEIKNINQVQEEEGIMINSSFLDGMNIHDATKKIMDYLEKKKWGKRTFRFRLRDWGISRQRYWGTPIPIVYCEKCGAVPVDEKDLPIKLPKEVKFGEGNPLETNEKWIKTKCPKCGGKGKRETDTMDTFVNSSWYFMRYCDSKNDKKIFDLKKVKAWCPVNTYVGGAEHACMHLIYARFYTKFLRDFGLINFSEPAEKLFHQGMLHAEGGEKMSKSKGNVVLPETVSDKYGIDAARFFLSGLASPDKDIDWSEKGIVGSLRFINRIFDFFEKVKFRKDSKDVEIKLNNVVKNVSEYYENFNYRKATIEIRELFDLFKRTLKKSNSFQSRAPKTLDFAFSRQENFAFLILQNSLKKESHISKKSFEVFLKLLNPICPHITEELWSKLGHKDFISISEWPKFDSKKLKVKKKEIDLNQKVVEVVKSVLGKGNYSKVYFYVVPFEFEKLDSKKLEKEFDKKVEIFSVKDSRKYDPQNKSKKARPGLPSFYLE